MMQATLPTITLPEYKPSLTIDEKFHLFHEANTEVYDRIVSITRDLKLRGFKRAGMKMIFERLRWLYAIQTVGEDYKLNNNYTALYARKVMAEHPELNGFFVTRERRSV